jgi:hypothetical protein
MAKQNPLMVMKSEATESEQNAAEDKKLYINNSRRNVFTDEGRCAPGETAYLTDALAAKMPDMQRIDYKENA